MALEGPFAEALANAYSEYVRAATAWQADPRAHSGSSLDWGAAEHSGGPGGHVGSARGEVDMKEYLAGSGEGRRLNSILFWLITTRGSDLVTGPLKS